MAYDREELISQALQAIRKDYKLVFIDESSIFYVLASRATFLCNHDLDKSNDTLKEAILKEQSIHESYR